MANYNKKLAIAIPTFNRPEVLKENLLAMLPELKIHAIPVYISDDSPGPETENLITELQSEYAQIHYKHNKPALGHDENFFATLAMPDCDYVWYMGDSLYFREGTIAEVIKVLDGVLDFCFINYRVNDYSCGRVESTHDFLVDRAWYLTLTGATIYGPGPRALSVDMETRKAWRNFVQLGLILKYCAENNARMYWYGKPTIRVNSKKGDSYWAAKTLDVFVGDWSRVVRSFKVLFSGPEVNYIIKSHAIHTGLFQLRGLLVLRINGGLNIRLLRKHSSNIAVAFPGSPGLAYLVALMPAMVARVLLRGGQICKRYLSGCS